MDVHYQHTDSVPADSFVNDEGFHDGGQNPYELDEGTEREIGIKTTERNPLVMSENENSQQPNNALNQFVTKVPQQDVGDDPN